MGVCSTMQAHYRFGRMPGLDDNHCTKTVIVTTNFSGSINAGMNTPAITLFPKHKHSYTHNYAHADVVCTCALHVHTHTHAGTQSHTDVYANTIFTAT